MIQLDSRTRPDVWANDLPVNMITGTFLLFLHIMLMKGCVWIDQHLSICQPLLHHLTLCMTTYPLPASLLFLRLLNPLFSFTDVRRAEMTLISVLEWKNSRTNHPVSGWRINWKMTLTLPFFSGTWKHAFDCLFSQKGNTESAAKDAISLSFNS